MANEKVLIDAQLLLEELGEEPCIWSDTDREIQEYNDWARFKSMIERRPKVDAVEVVHGHCDWCKPGEELCGTCRMFFDYYGDGGSDKCSSECNSHKCDYYEPIGFCPHCGAKIDGERKDND